MPCSARSALRSSADKAKRNGLSVELDLGLQFIKTGEDAISVCGLDGSLALFFISRVDGLQSL